MNTINTKQCALFLCPKDPGYTLADHKQFVTLLQNNGLISKTLPNQKNGFYVGEQFFDYIAYMGCSPTIKFEASETQQDFCHIKFHQYETAKLIVSKIQSRAPHCPSCNKPVKNWLNNKTESSINCDLCNTTANIGDFNWRKMAGFARVFIEITDIFPKEAVPQETLLDLLSEICKTEWHYFYSCQ